MSAPRFSVVIPTYNRAGWLIEAIESVLAQTLDDHEIVVADDGSTDDTAARLAAFGERVRHVRQPNRGTAAARNLGLGAARGAIVGFLDSDDRWEPTTLEQVGAVFDRRPEVGLVTVMAREITADGTATPRTYGKKSPGEDYTTRGLLWGDSGGILGFFVRRPLLDGAGGFDESLRSAEECDLCLRLSFATTLTTIRRPLLIRRKHDGNLSHDVALNARCWIALIEKLGRERPDFAQRERLTYRRALGKEHLRLGRELLAGAGERREARVEARRELRASVRLYPFFARAYGYLAWATLAPAAYARWRRRELTLRARLRGGADDRSTG